MKSDWLKQLRHSADIPAKGSSSLDVLPIEGVVGTVIITISAVDFQKAVVKNHIRNGGINQVDIRLAAL